jgi:hypothetical protein
MNVSGAVRTAFDAVLLWLGFFAGWSVASIPLTLTCRQFDWLWLAFGTGILGAMLAWRSLRRTLAPLLLPPADIPWDIRPPRGKSAWLWAGGLMIFAFAALAFVPTSNALPLWGITVLLAMAAILTPDATAPVRPATSLRAGAAWAGLGLLSLGIVALYLVILRPDADDAFYLNLAVGLLSEQTCMMAFDTMYGAENWPLLGSNYRVETLPTLTAALSWLTGLPVITVAHLILPVVWCVIWACLLAVIGHGMFGRHWFVFAVLSMLASMALAGTLQTWGVHGLARLFHGKAPLILIVIPLMTFLVARSWTMPGSLAPTFAALFGLCTVAVGLTANAIYLAPLVVLLSVMAAQIAWPLVKGERLVLLLSAAPPLAAGLWLLAFDRPVSAGGDEGAGVSMTLALWDMASHKTTLGVMMATLAAAALAGRSGAAGRWVSAYLALFLVLAVNPVLWPLYDRFVTGGLTFRLWWALPLPTFLAAALTWALLRTGRPLAGGTLVAGALAVMTLLPSGLIGMEGSKLHASIHKIPPDVASVVQDVHAAAPRNGTILAPEEIAAWLVVREGHPALVYTRRLYLTQSAPVVPLERLAPRILLANWMQGAIDAPINDLLGALRVLKVRLIVLPARNGPANADNLVRELGARRSETASGYTLWSLPDEFNEIEASDHEEAKEI